MADREHGAQEVDAEGEQRGGHPPALPTRLQEYGATLRHLAPSTSGRTEAIAWARSDNNAHLLATSSVVQDLRILSSKILPSATDVDFERDNHSRLIAVRSGNQAFAGPALQRATISYGSKLSGNQQVLFADATTGGFSGVVVPEANVEDWTLTIKNAEGVETEHEGKRVITRTQVYNLTYAAGDVIHITGQNGIPITSWPIVLRELSNLRKVDRTYDITTLDSLTAVAQARADVINRRSHVAFLDSMEAAFLEGSSITERVDAFVAQPTFSFLSKLKIDRPFSKQLFDADQKPVRPRPIREISPDSLILLQDMGYDGNFYDRKLTMSMPVHVRGDYRVKVGKNFRMLGEMKTMSARDLFRMINAKEGAVPTTARPANPGRRGGGGPDLGEGVEMIDLGF